MGCSMVVAKDSPKGEFRYKKDFKNGLKNGTHIYYFDIPLNPDSNLVQEQTLWEKINMEYEK